MINDDEPIITSVLQRLQDPRTIRQQAHRILSLARLGQLEYFILDPDKMAATADFVLGVMREQYPMLDIPYHSRWRHFEVGDIERIKGMHVFLESMPPEEQGKILYELVIISVFLDAGAGKYWHYTESGTGKVFSRSEGLAIASLELYLSGAFSAVPNQPLRVDSERLINFSRAELTHAFQVSPDNPLDGIDGRLMLLNRLGTAVSNHAAYFGNEGRLGNFYSYILSLQSNQTITASKIFQAVLAGFAEVWPKRLQFAGTSLGDVWVHKALKTETPGSEFIPFHKLSQWLTYSLIEPLEQFDIRVTDLDELTGLPEYRNGGLLIDLGLLRVRNDEILQQFQDPGSEIIIEWRALTVALLDELANTIRQQLGMSASELPLAKILQGGTWEAGRRIAKQKRREGIPPIQIISDGTVF